MVWETFSTTSAKTEFEMGCVTLLYKCNVVYVVCTQQLCRDLGARFT